MNKFLRFLILSLAVFLIANVLSGVTIKSFISAIFVVLLLSFVNTFVKPILQILTFPITIVTFGLFLLVINAGMILLVDWFLSGFEVDGFWWALLFSFLISIVNSILNRFDNKPKLGETKYYRIDEPVDQTNTIERNF